MLSRVYDSRQSLALIQDINAQNAGTLLSGGERLPHISTKYDR